VFTTLHWSVGLGLVWASTLATSALALLAVPTAGVLRARADRVVERLLFPSQRAGRELVRRTGEELGRLRTADELLGFLRGALGESLGCADVGIVAGAPDRPLVEVAPRDPEKPLVLAPADPLYVAIRRGVAVSATARPAA